MFESFGMDLLFNVPINAVSFGQVSFKLLMAAKAAGHNISLAPISDIDISTIKFDEELRKFLDKAQEDYLLRHDRNVRAIKLWHLVTAEFQNNGQVKRINPAYDSLSEKQTFISFYELDSPTPIELNVARAHDMVFTSNYTCEVFAEKGVKTRFVPLGYDSETFKPVTKKYFADDRIAFCLLGKFENRKHHAKVMKAWTSRFGNNKKYYLQCAVYNPFFAPQMNQQFFRAATDGKHFWNVNPVQYIPTNAMYNDFLNSNDIVLAMSGGEGWGIPEFHTIGLGKHAVVLNAHAYKDWATSENAVLINPLKKVPAFDGMFFKEGLPYNQGNIFTFDDEEFIAGCEEAIKRYEASPVNTAGLKLRDDFTFEKSINALINNV